MGSGDHMKSCLKKKTATEETAQLGRWRPHLDPQSTGRKAGVAAGTYYNAGEEEMGGSLGLTARKLSRLKEL